MSWAEQCELLTSEVSRGCSSRPSLRIRCRLNAHDKGRLEEMGVVARHENSIMQRGRRVETGAPASQADMP